MTSAAAILLQASSAGALTDAPAGGLAALVFAIAGGLFVLGVAAVLFRRDPLLRMMGLVMVLAAAALNLVAASSLRGAHGQAFAIFLAVESVATSLTAVAVLLARARYHAAKDAGSRHDLP